MRISQDGHTTMALPTTARVAIRCAQVLTTVGLLLCSLACNEPLAEVRASSAVATLERRSDVERVPVSRTEISAAVREQLAAGAPAMATALWSERTELSALYGPGAEAPLWIDAAGRLSECGHQALTLLANAATEGLEPEDYDAARLNGAATLAERLGPHELAHFDVSLSLGMLRYLRHVHLGRVDPRAIGFRMTRPADEHDFAALLLTALAEQRIPDTAAALTPPLVQYRRLRDELPRYRALAADPHLEPLPAAPAVVRPGEPYIGIEALYRRLVALGDLPFQGVLSSSDATVFEGPIVEGVKRFQMRHGLSVDGVLGKSTWAALQVPLTWRVRQIELALERLRWLPHLGDRRFVALNIPMFHLWGWDSIPPSGAPSLGMDVVVGRALDTQTPVFVEEMQYLIFRPYWNVPSSILRHEILPALQRDVRYLDRHDMEIVSGPGDDAKPVAVSAEALALLKQGQLRVRQRPGARNALGLIKFIFPNDANVYMHDTPAQELFSRTRRDFSHGCVRLQDPIGLAEWALQDQPEWTRDAIVAAMSGPASRRVTLAHPIQVILFYITAVVMPEDGTIRFAEDIYRHDAPLDRALQQRRPAQYPARSWMDSR